MGFGILHDFVWPLELTEEKIGQNLAHFVTDGLPDYMKSSKKVFGKKTNHSDTFTLQAKEIVITTTRWNASTERLETVKKCSEV